MSTAKDLLAALRKKHSADAVVREVVIDDPFELGYRHRDKIDRYAARSVANGDHYDRWVTREYEQAELRGIAIPDALPDGWTLRSSVPQRRIDALILASTGITAVEIKVTRADFRRDTEEKRRAWLAVTNRFIYLVPKGLVTLDEVPAGCGLWEYEPPEKYWQHGITFAKRAAVNKTPDPLPFQVTRALAYRVSRYEKNAESS